MDKKPYCERDSRVYPPFSIMNMYGRPVFIREMTDCDKRYKGKICSDCHAEAHFIVYERDMKKGWWLWCGQCDIGG